MSVNISVLSDSHVGQRIPAYPLDLLREVGRQDFILHAGDHASSESVDVLKNYGDLRAVHGNMDEIAISDVLPSRLVLDVEDVRIGLTHGWGPPVGIERRVMDVFVDEKVDVIVFGHSHCPCDRVIDGIRMINPGAVSGNIPGKNGSWGILTVEGNRVEWRLIEI